MDDDYKKRYMYENELKEINIAGSFSCNNNCIFCCEGDNDHKKDISSDEIKKKLIFAKKNNTSRVVFMGGEPTIRPDLVNLVRYAKKELHFKEVFIISNGRMFSYEKFAKQIVDAGVDTVLFSLVGSNSKIHDAQTRVLGSFNQLIAGVKNIKKYSNVIIGFNTTINKYNYKDLPNLANLVTSFLEPDRGFFEFIFVHPCGNALKYFDDVVPRVKDVVPYLKKAIDIGKKAKIKVMAEAIPFCYMHNYEEFVTELQMSREREKYHPYDDICDLNSSRVAVAKRKADFCKKCIFDLLCEGLWKNYANHFGFDELKPIPGKKIHSWEEYRKEFIFNR
jgi:MoaA/NifB/PqqE/SkfB family radical SAM enzyme